MKRAMELSGLAVILVAAVGLSGCGAMQTAGTDLSHRLGLIGQDPARVAPLPGELETVHAAAILRDEAVFWVASNGCTTKAHLTPVVRADGNRSVITLRRIRADDCRDPAPQGVEVRWTFEELGLPAGARVSVDNPYQMTAAISG